MKILFFATDDPGVGGSSKSLVELVTLLKHKGVETIVITPKKNNINIILDSLQIENYYSPYRIGICRKNCNGFLFLIKFLIKYFMYLICNTWSKIDLKRKIDFSTLDIIHLNSSVVDIGVSFSNKFNIPLVWHLREFGDLDFNFIYFHRNIGEYINNKSSTVIAITNIIKKEWMKKGISEEKIEVISHGVNPVDITQSQHTSDIIKILFVGKISKAKGQFEFVQAVNSLDNRNVIKVDIYGDGDYSYINKIKQFIKDNHLEDIIELKGYEKNINDILNMYDIGIVNSRCEAMGRVTIEYMFSSLCILASNRGANLELLENGKCGYLYDYGNVTSLANMLDKIINQSIQSNKKSLISMGQNARIRAEQYYDINKNINKFISLYEHIQK